MGNESETFKITLSGKRLKKVRRLRVVFNKKKYQDVVRNLIDDFEVRKDE